MTDAPPWMRKRPAAIKAVDEHVEDGMIVGIGTGNAACMAADRLAELVHDGFDLGFVSPPSRRPLMREDSAWRSSTSTVWNRSM